MDPFYRYRIPQLVVKVEKSKTVLVNIFDISKSINRLPITVLKYLSYEMGLNSMYKNKLYSINGHHKEKELTKVLNKFISMYVTCVKCSNPETLLCISGKNQKVFLDCTACGHIHNITEMHNLSRYLIKEAQNRKKV